ncbi:MAG: ABC transporter substrate-binding protein [Methylobacterium sp.]|uniref:ABC transporter substrate-binding protein n=1 Tax=Methylobacterium sp. TaxID=409 RepID=UPI002718BC8F|nr:ABC transporter substrate-binding protein [Methylobacterium sp.]MDO9429220.1 ABC transporter substrate-binding protein [Methylobacterium sp.]
MTVPGLGLRREFVFLALAVLLGLGAAAAYWVSRATVLTIAVAPSDGTEPAVIQAYADALAKRHKEIRLKILPFDDVRDSAAALQDGRADLAVVRPDVDLPDNGLTLAILRDQAMIIASPEASGLTSFPDLDRKRLAILAHRDADQELIKAMVEHYGLTLLDKDPEGPLPPRHVALVEMPEADLAAAFAKKRVDAVISVISAVAWVGQRLSRIRRERIEEATDRLLEIRREAQDGADAGRLEALAREIDDLAGDIAKHALERPTEARTMSAAAIAIDAARSTVKRTIVAGQPSGEEPDLAGRMTSTGAATSDAAG